MLEKVFSKFKNKKNEISIYEDWQKNISYIQDLKKNNVVITSIMMEKRFFILIFLQNKVFFLEKEKGQEFHIVSGLVNESIIKNEKVWECVKQSKFLGKLMETSSMVMFLCEQFEMMRSILDLEITEEREIWFEIGLFMSEIDTVKVNLPRYKKNENLWVD